MKSHEKAESRPLTDQVPADVPCLNFYLAQVPDDRDADLLIGAIGPNKTYDEAIDAILESLLDSELLVATPPDAGAAQEGEREETIQVRRTLRSLLADYML